jgi:hypothetical protein
MGENWRLRQAPEQPPAWAAIPKRETVMKIRIILNPGAEMMDRLTIDVGDDDSAEVSEQIHEALDSWVLAPGDTIKIMEMS